MANGGSDFKNQHVSSGGLFEGGLLTICSSSVEACLKGTF